MDRVEISDKIELKVLLRSLSRYIEDMKKGLTTDEYMDDAKKMIELIRPLYKYDKAPYEVLLK